MALQLKYDGKPWLDDSERLLFGKYRGSLIEDLASDDPGYLRWIVDNVEDISHEDREIIATHLARRGR